jgi:hypothetical protein
MTKLDKENFDKNVPLPIEFNDAHAAVVDLQIVL